MSSGDWVCRRCGRDWGPGCEQCKCGQFRWEAPPPLGMREWLAGLAMQGLLANGSENVNLDPYTLARDARTYADLLLAELAKGGGDV